MLAVIGGTVFKDSNYFKGKRRGVKTPYGGAVVVEAGGTLFLPRHGVEHGVPPHRINHHANALALKELGASMVIGVCSAGSLKESIPPGSITVPDDYMNLSAVPTFYDDKVVHITPKLDGKVRSLIMEAARKASVEVKSGGVYAQTRGPRLETKAEVTMLASFADLVGMTLASEATLCREAGLRYAGICSVDNLAHGLSPEELDFSEVARRSRDNAGKIQNIIANIPAD